MPLWILQGCYLWIVLLLVVFTVPIFRWVMRANWLAGTVVATAWVCAAVWLSSVIGFVWSVGLTVAR